MNPLFFTLSPSDQQVASKISVACMLFSTLFVTSVIYDTIVLSKCGSSVCFVSFLVPWMCVGISHQES